MPHAPKPALPGEDVLDGSAVRQTDGEAWQSGGGVWCIRGADREPVKKVSPHRGVLDHPCRAEVPFGPGLASGGAADALRHASKTKNPYLDVVPAGIPSQHPADVVSAYLPPLLHSLQERQQTVIVDCPPMIGVAETVLIAAMVDMVVVVVDTRRLHPDRLQQCLLRLDGAGANVVGVVLNRTRRRRRAGTYEYGYYSREEQLIPVAPPAPAPGDPPAAVARARWLGAPPPPPADRPQPAGRRLGRHGGSSRQQVFRSPTDDDNANGGDAGVAQGAPPRRKGF